MLCMIRETGRTLDDGGALIRSTYVRVFSSAICAFNWLVCSTAISTALYYKKEGMPGLAKEAELTHA